MGLSSESKSRYDIWGRSVYGAKLAVGRSQSDPKYDWVCFECDELCTLEMITKLSLGGTYALVMEIYTPRQPDDVKTDVEPPAEGLEVPPPETSTVDWIEDEDLFAGMLENP